MITRFAMLAVAVATASSSWGRVIPLDPNSEEPMRDQVMRLAQTATTGPTTHEALVAEADAKLAAIEREVARLRGLGERGAGRANALEAKLSELRARREGKATAKGADPELHVVNVQGFERRNNPALPPAQRRRQFKTMAGPVVVEVQPTGRPIVLAVCSYGPTKFDVRIAQDADVKRVLVGGYEVQQISGVPEGIPVEIHTYEGTPRSPDHFYNFAPRAGDPSEDGAAKLKRLTSLDITTLQIDTWYRGQPIVVGPASDEWSMQRLLLDLRPVYQEAAAYELAQRRAAVRHVRFTAVRSPVLPKVAQPAAAPAVGPNAAAAARAQVLMMRAADARPTLAEFTPAGPIEGTEFTSTQRINHVAIDPGDNTVYAIDEHAVYRIDPQTKRGVQLKFEEPELPRMSWTNGVTFDTKRGRVLVSAMNMLYAFDPATQKWSGVVNLENVNAMSFTYSAAEDCLYAVLSGMWGRGSPTRLMRYTAEGDPDRLIELSRPFPTTSGGPDAAPQLIAVGDQLVLLSSTSRMEMMHARMGKAGALPRQKLFLIDPKTGDVTFEGTVAQQPPDPAKLTEPELTDAWLALSADNPEESERAASRLASGGDVAVTLIQRQLSSELKIDAQKVLQHLAELDHEDFTRRDAASHELRRLGSAVEPMLRDALAKQPSAEAKSRIDAILLALRPDPQAERKPREALAIGVLGRIGTPAAIEFLGELAAGTAGSMRTEEARAALREFTRED